MPSAVTNASNFGFAGEDDPTGGRELTYIAAISEALREEMRRDPRVLVLGEDIAGEFGGAFKVTKGLEAEFGARRVTARSARCAHPPEPDPSAFDTAACSRSK